MAKQLEMMYEGKAKQVFATDDPTLAVIHYKDDATAFNGLKKGTIVGKGVVNNLVSNHLFKMLEANGVKTHLVEQLNERDSVVRRVSIVPIEVIVRNIAAGSLSKRLGLPPWPSIWGGSSSTNCKSKRGEEPSKSNAFFIWTWSAPWRSSVF